jgi:hypothetical protein
MPSLTSNFLNIGSLLDGLSELGIVKKHLLRAGREILMAVQSLLGFADQYVSAKASDSDHQQTISNAINYAQKTLHALAQQLPRTDEEEYRSLHRKVMNSILEVLEKEIRKNTKLKNQQSKMKAEVYEAIRNVLLKQMYEQETTQETSRGTDRERSKDVQGK